MDENTPFSVVLHWTPTCLMALTGSLRLTIRSDSVKLEKEADISPKKSIDYGGVYITKLDTDARRCFDRPSGDYIRSGKKENN